jgi:amicyanin
MSKNFILLIIGFVIIIGVGGIVYAVSQNKSMDNMDMDHQSPSEQDTDSSEAVQTDTVDIASFAYKPATITVKVGTKVTWTNQDSVQHTITTNEGTPAKIDSGLLSKGESFSYTFDKAGTYTYFCEPHPYMKGTVIVSE